MSDIQLRPYQERAVSVLIKHMQDFPTSAPILVAPCAAGKSVMLAALAERLVKTSTGMFLIITHRRELVAQTAGKLPSHMNVGVFSAGLGRKELHRVTVAGFQSIRTQVSKLPKVAYIAIDECEYASKGYKEFIDQVKERSPGVRVLGCTATPFLGDANRTALHLVPANKAIFTGIGAEITITELLRDGYLSPLTPYQGRVHLDTSGVRVDSRTGDFAQAELQAAVDVDELNERVADEIVTIFAERSSVGVFAAGVSHAEHIRDALRRRGESAEMVLGDTATGERDRIIERFRAGKLKFIVGVDVLLVGWDAPVLNGLAILRPTLSGRVHVQALGRGMRLHPGKTDCLVADFVGNTDHHGPINEIEGNPPRLKTGDAVTKICPECFSICLAGLKLCPTCGFEFEFQAHDNAQQFDPVTGLIISSSIKNSDGTVTHVVDRVQYEIRRTVAGDPALVASYLSPGRATPVASEYLNLWHHKASVVARDSERWLRRQKFAGGSVPVSAQEALARAEMGALKTPRTVTVRPGSPWPIRFSV